MKAGRTGPKGEMFVIDDAEICSLVRVNVQSREGACVLKPYEGNFRGVAS